MDRPLCSKCHVNQRSDTNLSWCKPCLAEHARLKRAENRVEPDTELRVCDEVNCSKTYQWTSSYPTRRFCSPECGAKDKQTREHIQITEKLCRVCNRTLPVSSFSERKASPDGLQIRCKSCHSDMGRRYREANADNLARKYDEKRDQYNASARLRSRTKTLKKYGLTEEDFAIMEQAQDGKCAICLKVPTDTLVVDHCHESGKIRGLLCRSCNSAIGQLGDDLTSLQRAVDYLTRS